MLCFSILVRKEFDGVLLCWSRKEVLVKVFSSAGAIISAPLLYAM